jgi:hypothetical protein
MNANDDDRWVAGLMDHARAEAKEESEAEIIALRQRVAELEEVQRWAQDAYGFLATYGKGWGSVRLIEDAPIIVKRKAASDGEGGEG